MLNIALIAQDKKKELMVQFCVAYSSVFAKHNICATSTTAKLICENTGLSVERLLPGTQGGEEQIGARISYNEIDLVLFFKDAMNVSSYDQNLLSISRLCDLHNIPIATNVATAEMLVLGIDRGDLNWRSIAHPKL